MAKEDIIRLGEVGKMEQAYAPKIEKTINWKLIIITFVSVMGLVVGLLGVVVLIDEINTGNALKQWNKDNTSYLSGSGSDPGPKPEPSINVAPLAGVDFLIIAMLGVIGPLGFWMNWEQSKSKEIERRLPDFLRDVAESGRFGMTLAASIQAAAKGKYGPLTKEIQRMSYQISWGISSTEVIRLFQQRLNTPLINRVCGIIIKAASAGGSVSDVLTMVSNDSKESQYSEDERRVEMITYVVVIYVAFFVFMATVLILNAVFIPQMEEVLIGKDSNNNPAESTEGAAKPQEIGGLKTGSMTQADIDEVKNLYLAAAIIHGLGDGIVAGVLDTGRVANGLRHSFLMVLIAYIMLRWLILFV